MILDALDKFNLKLKSNNNGYQLVDDKEAIERNYKLYIAKKTGKPKDDFPGKWWILFFRTEYGY
jgi:hypothetical protein